MADAGLALFASPGALPPGAGGEQMEQRADGEQVLQLVLPVLLDLSQARG